jgi:hypothetical protein
MSITLTTRLSDIKLPDTVRYVIFELMRIMTDNNIKQYERLAVVKNHPVRVVYCLGRLLRLDIVHFHSAYLGTEIFLRELTRVQASTLSSNPSSRAVDPQFLTN